MNLWHVWLILESQATKQPAVAFKSMRKIIQECRALDSTPIEDIYINPKMRDDMLAVLKGQQFVYCNAESRAEVFTILETHFQAGTRKDVGRPGLDLWRIFVFAVVKQCLDLDYDALEWRATTDLVLRQLLGHGKEGVDPAASSGLWRTCSF